MRKILLDACTFLWVAAEATELSKEAQILFADPDNEVYLSNVGWASCPPLQSGGQR